MAEVQEQEVEVVEAVEETSLSEDIAAAADQFDDGESEETVNEESTETAQETTQEAVQEPAEQSAEPVTAEQPEPAATVSDAAAPLDWSPTAKTQWDGLPKESREAISEHYKQANQLVQQTTEARQVADHFVKTVEPYRALMAAEGAATPFDAVSGLLNTAAQLKMGSPQQKAERIAGLINHYGIDIETLDSVLAGQAPTQPQVPQDPRIEQMWNQMQNQGQQRQDQIQNDAYQSIEQFGGDPKNQFFQNVRTQMADFLDVAAANGQQMSLQESYDRSCAMNPEIAGIIATQRAKEAAAGSQGLMQNKQNAASSIAGKRGAGSDAAGTEGMSMREVIESQFGADDRV